MATIWLDVSGTLIGNPDVDQPAAMQAIRDLLEAHHQVRLMSSAPGAVLLGLTVEDKSDAMRAWKPGDVVVDDERLVLHVALREKCIAVPASALLALVAALRPPRS